MTKYPLQVPWFMEGHGEEITPERDDPGEEMTQALGSGQQMMTKIVLLPVPICQLVVSLAGEIPPDAIAPSHQNNGIC